MQFGYAIAYPKVMGILSSMLSVVLVWHSVFASQIQTQTQLLENQPVLVAGNISPGAAQAQGMAGYVLNSETNMNTTYTRKLNRELLNPPSTNLDDGPLIQYVGPPPAPPQNGPLYQDVPATTPGLP